MKKIVTDCLFYVLLVGAGVAPANAQTLGDYYDSHAPVLPVEYPAKNYSAEILLDRLIEIAEGPELTREKIEWEFGLRYVQLLSGSEYLARGASPLSNELMSYSGVSPDIVFDFKFLNRLDFSADVGSKRKMHGVCIGDKDLFRKIQNRWQSLEESRSDHGGRKTNTYFLIKTKENLRRVDFFPDIKSDGFPGCIKYFSIQFGYKN